MFYDDKIDILGYTEGYLDDMGIWHEGQKETINTIECDVQPYSKELAYRDYGFQENVVYRVFSDPNSNIIVGNKCKYKGNRYIIKKVIDWDDYLEWMIDNE